MDINSIRNSKFWLWARGHAMNKVQEILFDWILYGTVIHFLGPLWGFVVMAPLSFIASYGMIRAYDWSAQDWLGIEELKKLRDEDPSAGMNRGVFIRMTQWILRRGDCAALILLSIKFDPFLTTLYMRKGTDFKGLTKRDWRLFILSTLICNLYWSVFIFTGLTGVEWIYHIIKSLVSQ